MEVPESGIPIPADPLDVGQEPNLSTEDLELGSEAILEMETWAYAREAITALIR
jgi:hypothetical protein